MTRCILGIDEGTTGITVILYDDELRPLGKAYAELTQHYPRPGFVEHDAGEIRDRTLDLVRRVAAAAPHPIAAVGITNQRETVVPLDADTGRPLGRAIVWQCRRTADACAALRARGLEPLIRARTGLVLDPYFSATKMRWLLEHDHACAAAASRGTLRLVTIDAFLVHALTGGRVLATDPSNAARTLLFDLDARRYDPELLELFGVPSAVLAEVRPSAGSFGETDPAVTGFRAPIAGNAGDQQAALFGQGCFEPGSAKNTYGTGCFLLMNAGATRPPTPEGILCTLGAGPKGEPVYALEGAVFIAGAAIQWLRDGLGIIRDAAETEALARSLDDNGGVYLVPSFTGLGAPYWDAGARGLIAGLTRGTTRAHLVRAALEAIAYQVHDLFDVFVNASGLSVPELRVDGGAVQNRWLMEFQAGLLGVPVSRGEDLEVTCRGAALLAAVGAGVVADPRNVRALAEARETFRPAMPAELRRRLLDGWKDAVARARSLRAP